uniref:Uncharacterized protein n=1 Tax=Romanomermis culicivorax TaxID=13658 RepID=A0A915KU34_ROMCU
MVGDKLRQIPLGTNRAQDGRKSQIAVQLPGLRYPIDLSKDTTIENQRKSVVVYQPEYVPGYEPPFFENILPSDQPGIQIMHIGNKVVVTPIGKQQSALVTGAKEADDDEGQHFKILILMERQPRDTSRTRSQHSLVLDGAMWQAADHRGRAPT